MSQQIGPQKISFPTFLLKIVAAVAGGGVGSLILMAIFFLTSSISDLSSADETYISPIFTFLLLMMVFISSTVGNILSSWLLSVSEKEKYNRISSAIYQIFTVSIIIFLLMVPVYFLTANLSPGLTAYAVALHLLLSAQLSANILEVVSNTRHALVGIYGTSFSMLVSAAVIFALANTIQSPTILLFLAMPIIWISIALTGSLTTIIYGFFARTYDKDFLATETEYGEDYGKAPEEEKEDPKAKDEAGADFLRHN